MTAFESKAEDASWPAGEPNENHGHESVMRAEVLEHLALRPGGKYIDATLGAGGHSAAILEASSPNGRVLGVDRDPEALRVARRRLAHYGDRLTIVEGHFSDSLAHAVAHGFAPVDGVIADLGVSSIQLDRADRGFAFSREGPLDMRMGPSVGDTAERLLARVDAEGLAAILKEYGEVERPRGIARAIVRARDEGRLHTTHDLARAVEDAVGGRRGAPLHPATRVFQAIRIAVNRELDELEAFLERLPELLAPGGRVVIISFHSLEDRLVKRAFEGDRPEPALRKLPVRGTVAPCPWERITKRPIVPTSEELIRNPRSRSAKMRVAARRA